MEKTDSVKIVRNGSIQSRMGKKFHEEMVKIQKARIANGKSDNKISIEKITNLIVRHKVSWKTISDDIINASEEEVETHGK